MKMFSSSLSFSLRQDRALDLASRVALLPSAVLVFLPLLAGGLGLEGSAMERSEEEVVSKTCFRLSGEIQASNFRFCLP